MQHLRRWVLLAFVGAVLGGCGGGGSGRGSTVPPVTPDPTPPQVVPKGARILEIQVSDPADGDFAGAFNLAQAVGMESASLSVDWNGIDIGTDTSTVPPTPIYADSDPDFLAIANRCYPNSNTKLSMMLRPITTLTKMAPPGFEDVRFDDPTMIARFNAFLDFVFAKIPGIEITALAIGSEVDLYLLNDDLRAEYLTFYEQVSNYARTAYAQAYPNKAPLEVAVEATHKGLLDSNTAAYYMQLNAFSDVIGVSYYPLEGGLVQDPNVAAQHFSDLVALYPNQPLHFFQLGYPSGYYSTQVYPEYATGEVSPVINSSETMQSDFVEAVFAAWDTHAESIDLIGFTWMHDMTQANVAATTANPAFGGTNDPPADLVEFLRTLGLRTDGAVDKPAWNTLANEVAARGWSDTGMQLTCN